MTFDVVDDDGDAANVSQGRVRIAPRLVQRPG